LISRNLVLTITDKSVSLDKSLILYRYDRGITVNIELKTDIYLLEVSEITKVGAIIKKPNRKISSIDPIDLVDGVYVFYLDDTWTDHLGEVGTYSVQLQLYSDNIVDECITIAPFEFEVKALIGIPASTSQAYVDQATVDNNYSAATTSNVPTGDLENGEYLKTDWISNDLITSGKLNKLETAMEFVVDKVAEASAGSNFSGSYNDLTDIPTNLATESFVANAIAEAQLSGGEVDLSGFATKDDLAKKSDVHDHPYLLDTTVIPSKTSDLTNDSGFLTEHQSLDGYATEIYVGDEISKAIGDIDAILDSINGEVI
jgi:hypothetical protein